MRLRSDKSSLLYAVSPLLLYLLVNLAVYSFMEMVWLYFLEGWTARGSAAADIYTAQGVWNILCLIIPAGTGCLAVRRTAKAELYLFSRRYPDCLISERRNRDKESSIESSKENCRESGIENSVESGIEGSRESVSCSLSLRPVTEAMLPVLLVTAVSFSIGINVLVSLLLPEAGRPLYNEAGLPGVSGFLLQAAAYGIFMPWAEEIVFRGILLSRMERAFGLCAAAVVSSAAFGLYHNAPVQGLYAFFMGILFALAYAQTGRLAVPFGLHGSCNLVILLLGHTGAGRAVCTWQWDAVFFGIAAGGFFALQKIEKAR